MSQVNRFGILTVGVLLAAVGSAAALEPPPPSHPCDITDPERPYICDIGPPQPVSMRTFRQILRDDKAVRALVRRVGMPYAVEMQHVRVGDPWYVWELRAYYPRYNRMFAFGRAFILNVPEISLLRYEGPIPPERRWPAVVQASVPGDAAARAERAAAEAEALADQATRYADRAEVIADQAGRDFKRSLVKN